MADAALATCADELLKRLTTLFPLRKRVTLGWRNFRVTAGMAYYRENAIALSTVVLTRPEAVQDTLVHEYAHLLAFDREGKAGKGHGAAWKQAMSDLGAEPRVRHNYPVARNSTRQQVDYRCIACGVTITRRRRLPARRKYVHARCGGDLRLLQITQVTESPACP